MSPRQTHTQIDVGPNLRIPLGELRFRFSKSSGPGGQNVNKVNTRATLLFDLNATQALTPTQIARLRQKLATRIDAAGLFRVVSSRHRTQAANRRAALVRFSELLADALKPRRPRRKTRIPAGAVARRLRDKSKRSDTKRRRGSRPSMDD